MAELREGTTIGGSLVWTQRNFPLVPQTDSLSYKGHKVYTTYDKPNADDNDFVSKQRGGVYSGLVGFNTGVNIVGNGNTNGLYPGNGNNATKQIVNIDIKTEFGIGIVSTNNNNRSIWINARTGGINAEGIITANKFTSSVAPTAAIDMTNKQYVDGLINSANNNANSRVSKAGDTMTGVLIAPNFLSNNDATAPNQLPRLSQVIVKGTVLDYGEY